MKIKFSHIRNRWGFSIYYLSETAKPLTRQNAAYIEVGVTDLSNDSKYNRSAVHFRPISKQDNKKFWEILETSLVNTSTFNHIRASRTAKSGRMVWLDLLAVFQGENWIHQTQSKAMSVLKNTYY